MNITSDNRGFLAKLSNEISGGDLDPLSREAGFLPPVSFDFKKFVYILDRRCFPEEDYIEYSWALSECEFERLRLHGEAVRLFVSSVFLYCNVRQPLGVRVESDFYWLGVDAALRGERRLGIAFFNFIERLCSEAERVEDSQWYLSSLSLCFLIVGLFPERVRELEERLALSEAWVTGRADEDVTNSADRFDLWRATISDIAKSKEVHRSLERALPKKSPSSELDW